MKLMRIGSFLLLLVLGAMQAKANDAGMTVLKSTPVPNSTLTESPKTVRIWFDEVPASEAWSLVIEGENAEYEVSYVHTMGETTSWGWC